MLKKILFASVVILGSISVFAQDIGTWKTYTAKKEIVSISAMNDNEIWCATTGGAFMYDATSRSFLQLSSSEGLTNPQLTSTAVDQLNQVWFGTFVGSEPGMLNVYNFNSGVVNKINDIYNSDFSQRNINSISTSGDTVLVSTAFGLSLLNPNNYSFYDTFVKFGDFDAATPVVYSNKYNNRFYVITDDGIAVQKNNSTNLTAPEAWDSFPFGTGIPVSTATEFANFSNLVLLATDRGIYQYASGNWALYLLQDVNVKNIFSNGNTLSILTNENGVDKVYNYDGADLTIVFENSDKYNISDLYITSSGVVYAGTNSGLHKIESGSSELLVPNGPANNAFLSLDVDETGTLWVGTGDDAFGIGVMSFNGNEWNLLNKSSNSEIISNGFHKVYTNGNTKYFCNWGSGLTVLKDNTITNYTPETTGIAGIPNAPNFLVVTDVRVDSKGNTWVLNLQSADRAPLSVIRENGEVFSFQINSPYVAENDLAYVMEIDQYDTKWFNITTGNVGLFYFNENGTFDDDSDDISGRLRSADGLLSSSVSALALDKFGYLWVGTNVGINIIPDPSNPTSRISSVTALSQQTITDIEVDPLNQKWVGTVQGLFHLSEDGTFVIDQYTSENSPLPSNEIKSISVDEKNGIVYVGTDFGLTALTTSSIKPQENMDDLFVYPNPVIIKGSTPQNITIKGLISNTSIKVLSIAGKLIKEFETPGGSIAFWDGKDEEGNFVSSGVYLIVAYDEDGANVATAKVAVLRD